MNKELKLRNEYRACIKLAQESDSKKEATHLKKEADELLQKLQASCGHSNTVILRSAFEGSYCMDYDDYHYEERICLTCGLAEAGPSFSYLIAKPIARFEGNYSKQIKSPLFFLLEECKEIALTTGYKV